MKDLELLIPLRSRSVEDLTDGAVAGATGAAVLLVASVAADLAAGREPTTFLWLPALAIDLLVAEGGGSTPAARHWAWGALFLVGGLVVLGAVVGWSSNRFRRAPSPGTILTVLFGALQLSFFAVDHGTDRALFEELGPWTVLGINALAAGAMTLTLWLRRPRLIEGRRELWDDEP